LVAVAVKSVGQDSASPPRASRLNNLAVALLLSPTSSRLDITICIRNMIAIGRLLQYFTSVMR
jgi:hypothetical protein